MVSDSGNVMPLFLVWLYEPIRVLQETAQSTPFSLARLFWVFLKAGALMFGSGYVLLAFIHDDLVLRLGWLTDAQLVDAIAIGQVTPGPLSTTATFVGICSGVSQLRYWPRWRCSCPLLYLWG
jgi:hypothetical protein